MRWKLLVAVMLAGLVWAIVPHPAVAEGDEVSQGEALYNKRCAMCHGKDGVAKKMGEGSANLNAKEWQASTSAAAIEKVIAEGSGKMKGLSEKMSAEEITAVANYVLTLK